MILNKIPAAYGIELKLVCLFFLSTSVNEGVDSLSTFPEPLQISADCANRSHSMQGPRDIVCLKKYIAS